jgi:hypothetical protein
MFSVLASQLSLNMLSLLSLVRDHTDSLSSHQVRDIVFQFIPSLIRNQGTISGAVRVREKEKEKRE